MKAPKTKKNDLVSDIKGLSEELLNLIGVEALVSVEQTEDKTTKEKTLTVGIDSENETGLLIGSHGSTLNAIQVFLGMALRQKTGEWVRVVVNIGDWKEKQEEHLMQLALQAAQRAKSTGQAQRLYNLSPNQRRIIHMHLSEDSSVTTQSEGEGEERYLLIVPKGA